MLLHRYTGVGVWTPPPASSCDYFLLPVVVFICLFLQRHCSSDADQPAGVEPSLCCSFICDMAPYGRILRPSFSSGIVQDQP